MHNLQCRHLQDWQPLDDSQAEHEAGTEDRGATSAGDSLEPQSTGHDESKNPDHEVKDDSPDFLLNKLMEDLEANLPPIPVQPVAVPQLLRGKSVDDGKSTPETEVKPLPTPCRADAPPPASSKKPNTPVRSLAHEDIKGKENMIVYIH